MFTKIHSRPVRNAGQVLVWAVGFEPTTAAFQARNSGQAELYPVIMKNNVARRVGLEPTSAGSTIQCFTHIKLTPRCLVEGRGVEPRTFALQGRRFACRTPQRLAAVELHAIRLVHRDGFEPSSRRTSTGRSPSELPVQYWC